MTIVRDVGLLMGRHQIHVCTEALLRTNISDRRGAPLPLNPSTLSSIVLSIYYVTNDKAKAT